MSDFFEFAPPYCNASKEPP